MAVHMIRMQVEQPSGVTAEDVNTELQSWIDDHSEWTENLTAHEVTLVNTEIDGSGIDYFSGSFRFLSSDDLTLLMDDAEAELQPHVSWYRFYYHDCDHDESDKTGCSWDTSETRTYGTIPSEIQELT